MTEKFSNNAVNTLSAAITTTTATSCTVTDATGFPASGNFRIKIDSEILIVTGVAGNTFTVTRGAEGTTAATHASGASVLHLLTKGGLEARVANRFLSDAYANKPAAGVKGRLFLPTDGLFLEYDDGAAWHQYGPFRRLKAPPQTGWSWVNQGNATATFNGSALMLEDPDLDANNPQLRAYVRGLAAGATSVVAAFTYNGAASMNGPKAGFCARSVGGNLDGHVLTWGIREWSTSSYPFWKCVYYTSPTVVQYTPSSIDGRIVWPSLRLFWVKFSWEADYKRFYYSVDGVNWIKWWEDTYTSYTAPMQFGIFIDPMNNAQKISLSLLHWEESEAMAETGKLGTADSLLASVQLALAAAEAAPPSITMESGRFGGQLGDTILALGGVVGPLTFNLVAESVLAATQTADSAPTFAAHSSPHWTLGGQDSRLGALEPAFVGADSPLPVPTIQTGRLGATLGNTVLGLDGVVGPYAFCVMAQSTLAIAQAADPAPTFAAHASPRWVLGGQDAYLAGEQLAFAGTNPPQPATGTQTGKLGTSTSILGGMRMALGEQEGGGGATITFVTATSALAASSIAALAGVVRAPTASSALGLTGAAGVGCARGENAASALDLTDAAAAQAVREVAAADALDLTDAGTAAAVFVAVVESAASLTAVADMTAVRTLAADDALEVTDEAVRAASITLGAESAIGPATAADASAVRAVVAESALDLTDEAVRTSRVIWTLAAGSEISLGSALGLCTTLNVGLVSPLDLADIATQTALRTFAVQSTIDPATAADATAERPLAAASPLAFTAVAGGCKSATSAATSAISLGSAAGNSVVRMLSAATTLAMTQAAVGGAFHEADVSVEDFLFDLDASADAAVVRSLSAQSALALAQTEQTARPWYLDAQTPIQTASYQYDQQSDTFRPVYEGLQDSAGAARPLAAGASQAIPLRQSASAVRVKPTAINVSAESVLELLGEIHPSPTGDTGNWLSLAQTATVDKCKTTQSALVLTNQAAAARSGPRGAASALALGQAVSFSITFAGVRQQYHPFVGEGVEGAPTPPTVTVGPPEHSALPFRLFSPATGTVTDSVTLRAPNLGNKDRLSFNRIVRETRGGTLVVFADPIWPKLETLVLSFSGLHNAQAQQLLAFLETHLGEEIGLLDWEGRCWKGVVVTPTNPVVQDARDSYSASLEFEGELVPA